MELNQIDFGKYREQLEPVVYEIVKSFLNKEEEQKSFEITNKQLFERIVKLEERVIKLEEKVISLEERVIRVEEELKYQRELLKNFISFVEKRFEQVDKRFEQIDKRFEEITKRLDRFMIWSLGIVMASTFFIIKFLS